MLNKINPSLEQMQDFSGYVKRKLRAAEREGVSRIVLAERLHPLLRNNDGEPRFKRPEGVKKYISLVANGCPYGSSSSSSYEKEENVQHLAYLLYAVGCDENNIAYSLFVQFDPRLRKYFPPEDGISFDEILNSLPSSAPSSLSSSELSNLEDTVNTAPDT